MTATIHTLHGEVQNPIRPQTYFDFVHKSIMLTVAIIDVSRRFAQIILDESLRDGNSYLAGEAQAFIEHLEKLEKGRMGR